MVHDVAVQDPASSVLNHEETVKPLEGNGRHGEEIEGDDRFPMVSKEAQPTPGRVTAPTDSAEISGHASLRHLESKLPEFPVDLGGSPHRVFSRQASN